MKLHELPDGRSVENPREYSSNKTAIYHFTDVSAKKPKIYTDQIKALEIFAGSIGLSIASIYCDKTLRRCDQTEFDRFIADADQYDALVVKDLYHISKNTKQCFRIVRELQEKGISIYTLENGCFPSGDQQGPLSEQLKVATYNCIQGRHKDIGAILDIENEILRFFAKSKTSWEIKDQYHDVSIHQVDGDQYQLQKLIACKDKYDLVLIHNVNDIHWRTSKFTKIREALGLSIYSLQEGYLPKQTGN